MNPSMASYPDMHRHAWTELYLHFALGHYAASAEAEALCTPHRPSFHWPMIGFVALRVTLSWPWSKLALGKASGSKTQARTTVSGVPLMLTAPWGNLRARDFPIAPGNKKRAWALRGEIGTQCSMKQQLPVSVLKFRRIEHDGEQGEQRGAACCYCTLSCTKRKGSMLTWHGCWPET